MPLWSVLDFSLTSCMACALNKLGFYGVEDNFVLLQKKKVIITLNGMPLGYGLLNSGEVSVCHENR